MARATLGEATYDYESFDWGEMVDMLGESEARILRQACLADQKASEGYFADPALDATPQATGHCEPSSSSELSAHGRIALSLGRDRERPTADPVVDSPLPPDRTIGKTLRTRGDIDRWVESLKVQRTHRSTTQPNLRCPLCGKRIRRPVALKVSSGYTISWSSQKLV
jgi:hypothetical protein